MAQNNKYLTYSGLETLVQKVASVITGTVGESGITLYLHGKTKDSSGNVINTTQISNVEDYVAPLMRETSYEKSSID